jgi:prepilin-type N-terminal cleavage/methylation domain-containing protein/prepilin-type processing-associated H-X9-DG protein
VQRRTKAAAFSLVELLVVTAILAILAAITFPIYRGAVLAAKRTVCINNFGSIAKAVLMYQADYDDFFPPVNYKQVGYHEANGDRTWVQTLAPYAGDFRLFTCPADSGRDSAGTPSGWEGYYAASLRSNLGYNYMYLSPLVQNQAGRWESRPVSSAALGSTSRTLMFIDSVWDRTRTGRPIGGGSWVTVPPCRYMELSNGAVIDTFDFPLGTRTFFGFTPIGWQPTSTTSWLVYGGAWPWHNGKFTMAYADGRADSLSVDELTAGCEFAEGWRGHIINSSAYIWDLGD